ncbi:MAG: tetratricopeptide repeat protein [Candidatus Riflebacteria bacterium]|nr:tetratricopeptide repeat protein [Candidatus Riflebacteria bacterium]
MSEGELLHQLRQERLRHSGRNPGLAALMSFFVMGLGQIYAGHVDRGIMLVFVHIGALICGYSLFARGTIYDYLAGLLSPTAMLAILYLGVAAFILLWIYNIKEAYYLSLFAGYRDWFEVERVLLTGGGEENAPRLLSFGGPAMPRFDDIRKINADLDVPETSDVPVHKPVPVHEAIIDEREVIPTSHSRSRFSTASPAEEATVRPPAIAAGRRSRRSREIDLLLKEAMKLKRALVYGFVICLLLLVAALMYFLGGGRFQFIKGDRRTAEELFAVTGEFAAPVVASNATLLNMPVAGVSSLALQTMNVSARCASDVLTSGSALFTPPTGKEALASEAERLEIAVRVTGGAGPDVWSNLLRVLRDLDVPERHEDALKRYLALFPRDIERWVELGKRQYDRRDFVEASRSFIAALGLQPRHARANYLLGSMYRELGMLEEAIPCLQTALSTDPLNPEFNLELGAAYMDARDSRLARKYLQKALSVEYKNEAAQRLLNQLDELAGKLPAVGEKIYAPVSTSGNASFSSSPIIPASDHVVYPSDHAGDWPLSEPRQDGASFPTGMVARDTLPSLPSHLDSGVAKGSPVIINASPSGRKANASPVGAASIDISEASSRNTRSAESRSSELGIVPANHFSAAVSSPDTSAGLSSLSTAAQSDAEQRQKNDALRRGVVLYAAPGFEYHNPEGSHHVRNSHEKPVVEPLNNVVIMNEPSITPPLLASDTVGVVSPSAVVSSETSVASSSPVDVSPENVVSITPPLVISSGTTAVSSLPAALASKPVSKNIRTKSKPVEIPLEHQVAVEDPDDSPEKVSRSAVEVKSIRMKQRAPANAKLVLPVAGAEGVSSPALASYSVVGIPLITQVEKVKSVSTKTGSGSISVAGTSQSTERTVGREKYLAGQLEEALPHLLSALKEREDPELYTMSGIVFQKLGMKEDGYAAALRAYQLGNKEPSHVARLGQGAVDAGKPLEGARYLREALVSFPNRIDLRLKLVDCLKAQGDRDGAKKELQTLLTLPGGSYSVMRRIEKELTGLGESVPESKIASASDLASGSDNEKKTKKEVSGKKSLRNHAPVSIAPISDEPSETPRRKK